MPRLKKIKNQSSRQRTESGVLFTRTDRLGARILDGQIEELLGDNGVLDVDRLGVIVERWGLAQDRKCAE